MEICSGPFYLPYLSGEYADGHLISLFIYLQFIKKIVIYKLTQTMCLDKTDTQGKMMLISPTTGHAHTG